MRLLRCARNDAQTGFILLPVVLAIVLIATIAFMLTHESVINVDMTVNTEVAAEADQVARAGLAHATWAAQNSGCAGDMGTMTVPFGQAGTDSYSATVTTPGGATTPYPDLAADQDAWFRSDNITDNNGTSNVYKLGRNSGVQEHAVVRFNLSSLPAGAQINSAVASFYVKGGNGHPEGPVTVHRVTADWTETGATWETHGDKYDSAVLGSIPAQPVAGDVRVTVNLTAQVQAWVNGQPNYGIMLIPTGEGTLAEYISREGAASQQPQLDVIVGTGPATPATITATGTLTGNPSPANDITRTLIRSAVPVLQPASTLVLQPGASMKDTQVRSNSSTRNYGVTNSLSVDGADSTRNSLVEFNLDGAVSYGAVVTEARLGLYLEMAEDLEGGVLQLYRVTRPWIEGIQNGVVPGAEGGATFTTYDGTNAWATPGGDYDPVPIASITTTGADENPHWMEWDVTAQVKAWRAGQPNHGLLVRAANSGVDVAVFTSSDSPAAEQHPRLLLTVACECGSACLAPQGSGNVLMVVVNPTTLVPADAYKKALFESWGYAVTVISESANQSAFDSEAVINDVVYVSSTVNSNTLGGKLANLPIGVISEDGDYNPDLGFASGAGWPIGSTVNVTDTSHYITAPFPAGPLEIYSAGMEQLTVSGTEGPGLQTLADTGSAGSLVVLDTGAMGSGGGPVAGRHVMLPLGRDSNFNWDYLNGNGRLLVQRALQWGTGNTGAPPKNLLLVVVDPTNLTGQETAKKTLIESWGYTVNLIDESDSQANFDAAIAANDVAYIPQDINSTNLGTKLRNATIGVVNEEGEQVDELGIAGDKIFKSRHEIDIVDNSHYITQPFATGLLTFVSSDQSVHMLSGDIAPGLLTLAQSFNVGSQWGPSLAVIETGDDLDISGTAAGRRVQLPWGGGTFDITALNADGQTIMQRAIEWGAGAGTGTLPIAHWKFDEGTGPTAFDSVGSNDATLNGNPAWTTGTLGDALDFDGSGDYVTTDSNFTPPPVGTVTFWMQVSGSPASHGRILGLHDTWEIRHVTTGTPDGIPYGLVFDLGLSGVNTEFVTTTTIDTPGQWYHIAAAYDTTNDAYAVYIDGVPHKSGTYPSALAVPAANQLSIGTRTGSSNYFDGMLDDVRIYDQFLSAAEIADLASGGGGDSTPPGYRDEFNSATCDPAVDYAGSDGLVDWSSWLWTEVNETDGPCAGQIQIGTDPLIADPGSNRLIVTGTGVRMQRQFDLSGFTSPALSFDYRLVNYPLDDFMRIRISTDGGLNWTELDRYEGPFDHSTYQSASYDISAFTAVDTRISFEFNGLSTTSVAYLDNVHVQEGGGGGGGGGGGSSCDSSGNYLDQFEVYQFDNSDGSIDWSTSPWAEVGESDGPTAGDIRIWSDLDSVRIRTRDNDNGGEGIEREADLTGAATATLSYDYRRNNLDNSNDYSTVEVSANGAAGPWTELARYQGPDNDAAYTTASHDISSFIGANTRVRFKTSSNLGNQDEIWFDNIEIACAP